MLRTKLVLAAALLAPASEPSAGEEGREALGATIAAIESKVIAWRRDIHQHPELSNREFRTAALVAAHLEWLGLAVRTGVAHTGVVGTLVGGQPGPVVALRADMDALPVVEETGLPFASQAVGEYEGRQVGVMHACGHDAHTAILMGVAEVLAGARATLPGTVVFLFQPAEEGPPGGERGGAGLMIEEGVLAGPPAPEAIFGLHVGPLPHGQLFYRPGAILAAADRLRLRIEGRQTHGSSPWLGVDPVTVAAQIITALQAIPSRQLDVTRAPAVVSIGSIHGGVRNNIIPEVVELDGTIRTLDADMRSDFHERIRRTAEQVATASGARAVVDIVAGYPATYNDPALTERMQPTLAWAAGGADRVAVMPAWMGAEDFSLFQRVIPGLYFFLGANPPGVGAWQAPPNHSPRFDVDEATLAVGVRALAGLAWDYLQAQD
ncbi:MAG: amidohydrolase [Thermoanaerobaculia bacterium]